MDQFLTIVKPAFDAAAPYVKQAADAAFQIATPIASDVASQADNALRNAGVDTQTVVYAAKVFSTLFNAWNSYNNNSVNSRSVRIVLN